MTATTGAPASRPYPTSWARTMRDHRLPSRPVDGPTLHLLDRLTASPDHLYDVLTVCEAIAHVARDHGGEVDLNNLRRRLWDTARGRYVVDTPQIIGATVSRLARAGALTVTGVNINEDRRGGNAGKPQRTYAYTAAPLPAYVPPPPGQTSRPAYALDEVDPGAAQEEARAEEVAQGRRPVSAAEVDADEAEYRTHAEVVYRDGYVDEHGQEETLW